MFFETWLEGSRQYANLDSYLIPKARWEQLRQTYCNMVGIPEDGATQLELKRAVLEENLARLEKGFAKNEFVRFENGELVLLSGCAGGGGGLTLGEYGR